MAPTITKHFTQFLWDMVRFWHAVCTLQQGNELLDTNTMIWRSPCWIEHRLSSSVCSIYLILPSVLNINEERVLQTSLDQCLQGARGQTGATLITPPFPPALLPVFTLASILSKISFFAFLTLLICYVSFFCMFVYFSMLFIVFLQCATFSFVKEQSLSD